MALIHEWLFDETSGTTVTDNVGSVNGSITGGVTLNQPSNSAATGLNTAFDFDGVDGAINFGDNLNFDRTDPFTFSVWVKPPVYQFGPILSSLSSAAGFEFALRPGQKVQLALKSSGGSGYATISTATNYPVGSWILLTATYNGNGSSSGIKIYINGVDPGVSLNTDSMASSGSMFDSTPVQMGIRGDGSNPGHINAKIDNLRVYDTALTPAEVLNEYNVYFQAPPALIHEWKFDETTGTTAVDSVGSVNGTITGGVLLNQPSNPAAIPALNTAFKFDGSTGLVDLGDNLNFTQTDPFTFSVWVKAPVANFGAILSSLQTTAGIDLALRSNGLVQLYLKSNASAGSALVITATSYPVNNTWFLLTATYDGSGTAAGIKIYFDGVDAGVSGSSDTLSQSGNMFDSASMLIGARPNGTAISYLNATIDNLRVYNYALTPAEALTEYDDYIPVPINNTLIDDSANTPMVTAVNIPVLANDTINQSGTITIPTAPSNGVAVVALDGISIDYTPAIDFAGVDTFTYDFVPSDGVASVDVNVTQTIVNDTATVAEGLSVNIDVLNNDVVSTSSILSIDTQGSLGNAQVQLDNTITYTSTGGVGADTFTYNIGGDIGQVQVTVTGGIQSDSFTVTVNSANNILNVQANDSLSGTVIIASPPANGVAVLSNNDIDYTPNPNFTGTDSMSYEVDGLFATIAIEVVAPIPIAVDDGPFTTAVNTPITIDVLANDTVF